MSESVAAVVVTFNRSRLLLECLDALLRQTRPLDRIFVVDNASSDDTAEALQARGFLQHPLIAYRRLNSNTGGAGGFCEGMKDAFEAGFDWIWVMDDDAEPFDDALERMTPGFEMPDIGGVASVVMGLDGKPQAEHRGWLQLHSTRTRAHRVLDSGTLPETMQISFASFVGLAVHRGAIRRIGLPKPELFIKGDDLEYCVRLATLGPLVLMSGSKILHKDGASAHYELRRRFGYSSHRIPVDRLWPNYFGLRNLVWMRLRYCGGGLAAGFAARHYLRLAVGILIFDTDRRLRLRFYWDAIADAWSGTFDNEKPRRLVSARATTAPTPPKTSKAA